MALAWALLLNKTRATYVELFIALPSSAMSALDEPIADF